MNMEEAKTINAVALHELGVLLKISDNDMDDYIMTAQEMFKEHAELRVSEALPKIVTGANMDDVVLGIIIMTFMSDYVFDTYFKGEFNGI